MHVGLLDHRGERLLGGAPRLQEGREAGALAQLRDGEIDAARPGLPRALAIAVAVVHPLGAAGPQGSAGQPFYFQRHQPVGRIGQQLAHEVGISALLDQLNERHSVIGHRRLLSEVQASQPEP